MFGSYGLIVGVGQLLIQVRYGSLPLLKAPCARETEGPYPCRT